MNGKDHDFDKDNVCKNCGVERHHNTKKRFYLRDGHPVTENACAQRAAAPDAPR